MFMMLLKGWKMKLRYSSIIGYLAVFLSVASFLCFYPGSMTWDSLEQLRQARTGDYGDWHPPAMAFIWSLFVFIKDGPSMMLIFHISMLWTSAILLYRLSTREKWPCGVLFLLIPILPWVLNFEFVIWKDIGMAYSWGAGVAICLYYRSKDKFPRSAVAAVLLLFFYGALIRSNSLAAAPFLFLFFVICVCKKISIKTATAVMIGSLVLCVLANMVLNSFLDPKKTNPISYVMFDDLIGLKLQGKDVNLDFLTEQERSSIVSCPHIKENKVGAAFCLDTDRWADITQHNFKALNFSWRNALSENFLGYLYYRSQAFLQLTRSPFSSSYDISQFRVVEPPYVFESGIREETKFEKSFRKYVHAFSKVLPGAFKPYVWMLLSIGLIVFFARHASSKERSLWLLPASGLFYALSYFPVTPAADLRYVYWLCFVCTISGFIAINEYCIYRRANSQLKQAAL